MLFFTKSHTLVGNTDWYNNRSLIIQLPFMCRIRKRQIMRQSLNSTPPVMGGAASGIRPEDYLTMA